MSSFHLRDSDLTGEGIHISFFKLPRELLHVQTLMRTIDLQEGVQAPSVAPKTLPAQTLPTSPANPNPASPPLVLNDTELL